jgi:hypothetical protein
LNAAHSRRAENGWEWRYKLSREIIKAAAEAGLLSLGVSINGLEPLLAELHGKAQARDLTLLPGNNIGYFGPMRCCGAVRIAAITRAARPARTSSAWKPMAR